MTEKESATRPAGRRETLAVLVPCHNEASSIHKVVEQFRGALPTATIWVYDNASTDGTAAVAREAGARLGFEETPGKGRVVRRMFTEVEADAYVLVDGDGTYDAGSAPQMVRLLQERRLDMVVGIRVAKDDDGGTYRFGHRLGNRLLTSLVRRFFGRGFSDVLSGYRVISRRFVKSFPCLSDGFEIETELAVHALQLRLPCAEMETQYFSRPAGSTSKLRTYSDGWRIFRTIVLLFKEVRPLLFFGLCALAFLMLSLLAGVPVVVDFLQTGLVLRQPTAILAAALVLAAAISFTAGSR
jgi:glycosyltransferase involved in cell wall biosynthesis